MLLDRFLPRIEFDSYEDFKANYKVNVPENFNFGFDIVDAWADSEPEKKALVWCDDHDHERIFQAFLDRDSSAATKAIRESADAWAPSIHPKSTRPFSSTKTER